MRQLFPTAVDDVDPVALYAADDRRHDDGRAWLMMNMIASLDGAISIDGVSGGLGGPADKAVFTAIRGVADTIVVASGTVIAEDYGPPRPSAAMQAMRVARGQAAQPRLAIVSGSLRIDPDHRVFDPDSPPIVITHGRSDADRRARLADRAEVLVVGDDEVDLDGLLPALRARGARVVLAEGGPTFNGALVAAGLVDELCLSTSPVVVGGTGPRIVWGDPPARPLEMSLQRTLFADGLTFHRYVRTGDQPPIEE